MSDCTPDEQHPVCLQASCREHTAQSQYQVSFVSNNNALLLSDPATASGSLPAEPESVQQETSVKYTQHTSAKAAKMAVANSAHGAI